MVIFNGAVVPLGVGAHFGCRYTKGIPKICDLKHTYKIYIYIYL